MKFSEYEIGSTRKSFSRTITEADIVTHAGQTGDFYPHHMDAEWCATQPFGTNPNAYRLWNALGTRRRPEQTIGEIKPNAVSPWFARRRQLALQLEREQTDGKPQRKHSHCFPKRAN